jgi:hypothetical protein
MRSVALVCAALSLCPWVSAAQDAAATSPESIRWLVVPVRGAEADDAEPASIEALHRTAEAFRQELALRGKQVWPADDATERFEVVGSAPAPEVSQTDIDRWVERSRAAVRYLARADYKAARRELKAAQRLAEEAAEELNREAARAQEVLDTCLFMVRAYVETKNQAEARHQAHECRLLVPRVEPTAFRHTPEVRALLDKVDAEIAAEPPGMLEVTSEPPGCLLRINGVEVGRTPLDAIQVPVGTYRVQVECEPGQRGRIHRVAVASGANFLAFDGGLEAAVRSDWTRRMQHADQVGYTLDDTQELVVSGSSPTEVRIDLNAEGFAPASVWTTVQNGEPEAEDVRRALDALFEGRSVDFTGAHPLARPSWWAERAHAIAGNTEPKPVEESKRTEADGTTRPPKQRIAGWTLFGTGIASIGASVGLHVWRGDLGDRFVDMPESLNAAQRWRDARIAVWTTAAFGGAATSAAMPLLLPSHARTPWWGWALGAAGLGLTGYAVYEGVTMTSCPDPFIADEAAARACVDRGQEAGRISLALAGAAPLLTIPLVYLIRPLRAEPSVSVSGSGAVVKIRKAF